MPNVLLINGSPNADGCTFTALSEVERTLRQHNIDTELMQLGRKPVSGCLDCDACMQTRRCVIDDRVNDILGRLETLDAFIFGSPVYFAGACGQLCAFLDRLFHLRSDLFAGKLGAAVVSCRRGGASAAFDRLNKYFTISNMVVVGSQY